MSTLINWFRGLFGGRDDRPQVSTIGQNVSIGGYSTAPAAQNKPKPAPTPRISDTAFDLIVKYEVSSKAYYDRYLSKPTWPGLSSGVTIGVGYDLGYNTPPQFHKDWAALLPSLTMKRLAATLGLKGVRASSLVKSLSDIRIPWDSAIEVFRRSTLPRFIDLTLKTYPGAEKLHPDVLGALVSVVFNRGASTVGSRRKEMAMLKEAVKVGDVAQIEMLIRQMKRLWVGTKFRGLVRRRDAEADLVKAHV
jgi:hypothetical protein